MALIQTKDDIVEAFKAAEKAIKPYFEPLAEFERLARNKPHPSVVKAKMPSVTDGTLASVVQSQPRRIIQQLPTGKVKLTDDPNLAMLGDYIWTNQILPNANTSGDPLQKAWIASTKAKTYGAQPAYVFFKRDGEYFGADFVLPYVKDVYPEPGKVNANDSEYVFMVSWWTSGQIKSLIDREKKLKVSAKERSEQAFAEVTASGDPEAIEAFEPEVYKSEWNLTAMKELLDNLTTKDENSKTPAEKDKDTSSDYAKLVHVFQRGIGANFFTYSTKLDKIVRTKVNPDPRGCIPIVWMYDNLDLSNPLGRGTVEMSGGMQNLIDSEVQSYQFVQKVGQAPPLKKWGTGIANSTIKWKPFAVWDMGSDPNAKLDPVDINTSAIQNFPSNYGLMKSQILNLTNNQDHSISADAGNPTQSKTQAGVNAQEQRVAVDDNYFRKQFDAFWERLAETMLNVHFAESSGVREIELTEDFLKKMPVPAGDAFAIEGNTAQVMYDQIKDMAFKFEVDAGTSQKKDDNENKERLIELLTLGMKFPNLIKVDPLIEDIVNSSGVDDPKKLLFTPQERQQLQMQQRQAEMAQAAAPPAGATPQGPQRGQLDPEDQQLVEMFAQAGFSQEQAMQGLTLMHSGRSADEVMGILTQAQQGGAR